LGGSFLPNVRLHKIQYTPFGTHHAAGPVRPASAGTCSLAMRAGVQGVVAAVQFVHFHPHGLFRLFQLMAMLLQFFRGCQKYLTGISLLLSYPDGDADVFDKCQCHLIAIW
ncbi:hypothetical protein, partial [uncultured Aquitalea sp.]|uniref:hypothetical protein n=1 Tax=uncultured Aquitalea sp. TaxID=540272 RepID=UPI0025D973EC